MNEFKTIDTTERVVQSIRKICVAAAMTVTRDTPGVVNTTSTTAKNLDQNIELINSVVEYELVRRYGA